MILVYYIMKVFIAITTAETVHHETMESIYNLVIPLGVQTELKIIHSYDVSKGRNELVQYARRAKADYILFVDSDVILPPHTLTALCGAHTHVVLGTYPRKDLGTIYNENPYTTLYRHDESNKEVFHPYFLPQNELPLAGLCKVDCGGLGCALVKMDVFDKLSQPYFVFAEEQCVEGKMGYCLGEDMYFFRNCLRVGIQPYAEGSVRCGHIGKFVYTFKDQVPNQIQSVVGGLDD